MDSETTVIVTFKLKDGYQGNFSATINGVEKQAEHLADGRYQIRIAGISAHKLGDTYTIKAVTSSGTETVKISALSYVYAMFTAFAGKEDYLNAASAIYQYYDAVCEYRAKKKKK